MKKGLCILMVVLSTVFSCTKESAPAPALPTDATVTGYWSLTKIQFKGQDMAFKDFPLLSSNPGVKNMYFAFRADKSIDYIFDMGNVIEYGGTWALSKDLINVDFTYLGTNLKAQYQVSSFKDTQMTLVDQFYKDYALTYTRMAQADYPELAFSATVNGTAFVKPSITPFYHLALNQYELSVYSLGDGAFWAMNLPSTMTPGTYPMSVQLSALYTTNNSAQVYGSFVSGSITIVKLSTTYISMTFNMVLKDNASANQVTITNGVYKSIIEPL